MLAFLLPFGFLLGLHGCVILRHVENVDVLPVADGLQQAQEANSCVPSKERVEAVKHHPSVAVTQLKPERAQTVTMAIGHLFSTKLLLSVLFSSAAVGSADLLGLDENIIELQAEFKVLV